MDQAMTFPRYEFYKNSDTDWLGDIPSDWLLGTIRAVTQLKSEKNQPELQVLSVYREYGVIPKNSRDDNHNATSLDTSGYKVVNKGDLVVNKMKAWQGSMGISEHDGIVSPAYITCRVDAERVYPKFLHYLLRSQPYIGVYNDLSYGVRVGQWDMHYEDFKRIPLPLPDRTCQERIANFLDQKTAEIDEAIAKKQRLIDLLKEQKAILINQAVTKGLNPDVPLRDSGVEWIGEVPANWNIKVNRELFVERKDSGSESLPILSVSLHTGVSDSEQDETENIRSKVRIEDKTAYRRVYPGDIAFNMMRAWQGAIGVVKTNGQVSPAYVIATPCCLIDGEYFEYQYRTSSFIGQMDRFSKGITDFRKRLYWDEFKRLFTIVPPIDEQKKIIMKIREIAISTDQVVEKIDREIEHIREFRSILISTAVTGKIKI